MKVVIFFALLAAVAAETQFIMGGIPMVTPHFKSALPATTLKIKAEDSKLKPMIYTGMNNIIANPASAILPSTFVSTNQMVPTTYIASSAALPTTLSSDGTVKFSAPTTFTYNSPAMPLVYSSAPVAQVASAAVVPKSVAKTDGSSHIVY